MRSPPGSIGSRAQRQHLHHRQPDRHRAALRRGNRSDLQIVACGKQLNEQLVKILAAMIDGVIDLPADSRFSAGDAGALHSPARSLQSSSRRPAFDEYAHHPACHPVGIAQRIHRLFSSIPPHRRTRARALKSHSTDRDPRYGDGSCTAVIEQRAQPRLDQTEVKYRRPIAPGHASANPCGNSVTARSPCMANTRDSARRPPLCHERCKDRRIRAESSA